MAINSVTVLERFIMLSTSFLRCLFLPQYKLSSNFGLGHTEPTIKNVNLADILVLQFLILLFVFVGNILPKQKSPL